MNEDEKVLDNEILSLFKTRNYEAFSVDELVKELNEDRTTIESRLAALLKERKIAKLRFDGIDYFRDKTTDTKDFKNGIVIIVKYSIIFGLLIIFLIWIL